MGLVSAQGQEPIPTKAQDHKGRDERLVLPIPKEISMQMDSRKTG